ncbi:MAG: hypothetical protein AAF208_12340 [Cyanobacteria bacterium P01_A01_bin.45]
MSDRASFPGVSFKEVKTLLQNALNRFSSPLIILPNTLKFV